MGFKETVRDTLKPQGERISWRTHKKHSICDVLPSLASVRKDVAACTHLVEARRSYYNSFSWTSFQHQNSALQNMSEHFTTEMFLLLGPLQQRIYLNKKSSLRFTVRPNPDALPIFTSISSLLLLLLGQNQSQYVVCTDHLQTDRLLV